MANHLIPQRICLEIPLGRKARTTLQNKSGVEIVRADLCGSIWERNLEDWERLWRPDPRRRAGPTAKWDWRRFVDENKSRRDARTFAVEYKGVTQGMMLAHKGISMDPSKANAEAVIVSWLESAPWNRDRSDPAQMGGAGTMLMLQGAMRYSMELGLGGTIELYSLDGAAAFYRGLQMTEVTPYFFVMPSAVALMHARKENFKALAVRTA